MAEGLRLDLLDTLSSLHEQYGDVCCVAVAGQRIVILFDPDDVQHVYVKAAASVRKGFAFRRARRLLGNGLITSDGELHLRQRRTLQPCLQPRNLSPYASIMVEEVDRAIERWQDGGIIDVEAEMNRLGLAIIGRTMFSVDLSAASTGVHAAIKVARNQFVASLHPLAPIAHALPLPSSLQFRAARKLLRTLIVDAVNDRISNPDPDASDLLSLLIEARGDADHPMSMRQLVDEALTMLLAGHDTIANTLTWALHTLAQHPDERVEVERHVDDVLDGRAPEVGDVERLDLVRAAFLETLRLYPQCYTMTRTALEQIECPNVTIRPRWEIMVPQWSIHRDPRWWESASTFQLSRFAGDARATHRYAYFPFGGGRRVCIGQAFSMMEGSLVLGRLMQRCRFEQLADAPPVVPQTLFTLFPGSINMRVTHRVTAERRPE